jgi:hypothetical protein
LFLIRPSFVMAQQDTPKKVSMVVKIKEKTTTNIAQLPADNIPAIAKNTTLKPHFNSRSSNKKIKINHLVKDYKPKTIAKVKQPNTILPINAKPIKIIKEETVVVKNPIKASVKNDTNGFKAPNDAKKEVTNLPTNEKTKYITTESENHYVEVIPTTGKVDRQSTLSYFWIGALLLLIGIILGLLFGRAAFLISACGMIFIILGFFIA